MSTTKTKKEAKLKARKTSLSKKTNEELIDIILKKDNTERKNNDKIMNLTKKVDDLNVIMEANAQNQAALENELNDAEQQITECNNKLEQKEKEFNSKEYLYKENIDNFETKCSILEKEIDSYHEDINRIKTYKMIGLGSIIVNIILLLIILL